MDVRSLQYYLDVISYFNDAIPDIDQDGYFGLCDHCRRACLSNARRTACGRDCGLADVAAAAAGGMTIFWQCYRRGMKENNAGIYPGYFLSPGMENEDVRNLQTYLKGIADYSGVIPPIAVTGVFDEATRDAVAALQAQNDLPPTGNAGTCDMEPLYGVCITRASESLT